MTPRSGTRQSQKLQTILASTELLMLEQGYGAVTYRSVAAQAGVAPGLVQYYFPSLDDLFVAVLRDATDRLLLSLDEATRSEQPLRAAWSYATNARGTALLMEFMALANHREAVRSVIGEGGETVRQALLAAVAPRWREYGLDDDALPAPAVLFMLACIPRMIHLEERVGTFTGHAEATTLVERFLDRVEPRPLEK